MTNYLTALSKAAQRAIRMHGEEACRKAYHMNAVEGEGGTMISYATGLHINATSAAIAAGEELFAFEDGWTQGRIVGTAGPSRGFMSERAKAAFEEGVLAGDRSLQAAASAAERHAGCGG